MITLEFSSHIPLWQVSLLTVFSFAVGVLGGFVGLALGTLRLPALLLLGLPVPLAAGTNILVSTLSAATGALRHWRSGRVNMPVVAVMGIPSLLGAFVGGFASDRAPEGVLIGLAAVVVVWQGVELVARGRRLLQAAQGAGSGTSGVGGGERSILAPRTMAIEAVIGLAIDLLGGAVGLILGSLRLPALVRILKMDVRVAVGTNLSIGFLMGSFGGVRHAVQGKVDYRLLALMGLSGMAGAWYGARLTGRVRLTTLLLTTGWVLTAVGLVLLWEAFRRT